MAGWPLAGCAAAYGMYLAIASASGPSGRSVAEVRKNYGNPGGMLN